MGFFQLFWIFGTFYNKSWHNIKIYQRKYEYMCIYTPQIQLYKLSLTYLINLHSVFIIRCVVGVGGLKGMLSKTQNK